MSRPHNSFLILLRPVNSPFIPQKVKNDLKIKSKSNVRIGRNRENERCSATWVDLKKFVEPRSNSKNSQLGPQTVKNETELSQNQKLELKKT